MFPSITGVPVTLVAFGSRMVHMGEITLQRVSVEQEEAVQSVLEKAPQYYQRVEGVASVPKHMARKELEGKPSKQSPTYEKVFLLVHWNNVVVGVVDLHKDHPAVSDVYIGLLLLSEEYQSKGLGKKTYEAVETFSKSQLRASRIVLGVANDNDVSGYWIKMGFSFNKKTYTWKGEEKEVFVREMEKKLV